MCEKSILECKFCKKTFTNPGGKAIHERWCKSNPNRNPIEGMKPPSTPSKVGGWECKSCHSIFRTRRELEMHLSDNPDCHINKRKSDKDWTCKVCGSKFRIRVDLFSHIKEFNHRIIPTHKKELYKCQYCNKEWLTTKDGVTKHENYCIANPNRTIVVGRPHSDEEKKLISEKRKEYLATHPDEHVWKRHSKFTSVPCNDLKEFLRFNNYSFIEEASIIPDRNFAVDICFPDKMIVVEVNGNQHYDISTMELSSYYQERHDIIESFGWTVIEVPYNKAYSDEFRVSLLKLLDGVNVDISTFNYKYECVNIYEKAAAKRKEHNDKLEAASKNGTLDKNGRLSGNKIATDELNRRKELILNSDVDLTKFGWVGKVADITGLSIRVIHTTVDQFDDLKSKVFRRGN